MKNLIGLAITTTATCGTWLVPEDCQTIQDAIDAASDGDEIIVAQGIWKEQIDFTGKTLLIYSEVGAEETVIDAGGQGTVVSCTESTSAVLEGFTIRGGKAELGGGILVLDATPTFRLCMIDFNTANKGGGVYVRGANPVIDQWVVSFDNAHEGDGVLA
ncbi:MAG: hypothetical protein H8E86_05410 [Planctomycetes bacterium]|nr:hypothetical protein [Planctomycetota bacterium]